MNDCFLRVRKNHSYIDKTRFIPRLENGPPCSFFVRPPKSGKSLFVSMLAHYYDAALQADFHETFEGTWIHEHLTPDRSRLWLLLLDLKMEHPTIGSIERTIKQAIALFLAKYDLPRRIRDQVLDHDSAFDRLNHLFLYCRNKRIPIFCLVDGYGEWISPYRNLEFETGINHFMNLLKYGSELGPLERIFVTGILPIRFDALADGFNCVMPTGTDPRFSDPMGFTSSEVGDMIANHEWSRTLRRQDLIGLVKQWSGGYRFHPRARETMFLPGLVRHALAPDESPSLPAGLGRLVSLARHAELRSGLAGQAARRQPIPYAVLPTIHIETVKRGCAFPSLLFYLGLLTYGGFERGLPWLRAPNQYAIEQLHGLSASAGDFFCDQLPVEGGR